MRGDVAKWIACARLGAADGKTGDFAYFREIEAPGLRGSLHHQGYHNAQALSVDHKQDSQLGQACYGSFDPEI